ncbi:unnamed protein product [Boreogadus saida]
MDEEREEGAPTSKTSLSVEHGRQSKAKSPEQQQRAHPPGPSCVSMKSDRSMGRPPNLKDGCPSREERVRNGSDRKGAGRLHPVPREVGVLGVLQHPLSEALSYHRK